MYDMTPLMRLHARWRAATLARQDAVAAQQTQLMKLVRRAAATPFGRAHDFGGIAGVADFQARVPLRRYDEFWRDWWQPRFPRLHGVTWPGAIPFFALSSGTTTGTSKYIPVSPAMVRSQAAGGLDVMVHHLTQRPHSRVLGGRIFTLGGSTDLVELAPGIRCGDLSGVLAWRTPAPLQRFAFPPPDIALMRDWDAKVAACIAAAGGVDIRAVTGTPSWLQILFDRHAAALGRPALARELYPNLELLVHGGVSFVPYRAHFEAFLAGSHAELREVYASSEGFIAVADRGPDDGLRLLSDIGLFFEFIPFDELAHSPPRRHWLADIELGVDYAVAVSSCAGLWAYLVGDLVRFVSRRPPRLIVSGRTSQAMSAFGEHLIGAEIDDAVAMAARAVGAEVADYAMGALFPAQSGDLGGHLFIVEFDRPLDATGQSGFVARLDARLSELNDDYRAHRSGGFGMAPPRLAVVSAGFFAAWMKSRGKLGGQHKVPRVVTDPGLWSDLRAAAGRAAV